MAMKVINKQEVLDKEYVNHTILEKEIMAMVCIIIFYRSSSKISLIYKDSLRYEHILSS